MREKQGQFFVQNSKFSFLVAKNSGVGGRFRKGCSVVLRRFMYVKFDCTNNRYLNVSVVIFS